MGARVGPISALTDAQHLNDGVVVVDDRDSIADQIHRDCTVRWHCSQSATYRFDGHTSVSNVAADQTGQVEFAPWLGTSGLAAWHRSIVALTGPSAQRSAGSSRAAA